MMPNLKQVIEMVKDSWRINFFESKRVIFLAGGSYDHCHKYFDLYSDFYFKFGSSVFKSNIVLGYLIDRKQLARLSKNAKIIGKNHSTNENSIIMRLMIHI